MATVVSGDLKATLAVHDLCLVHTIERELVVVVMAYCGWGEEGGGGGGRVGL